MFSDHLERIVERVASTVGLRTIDICIGPKDIVAVQRVAGEEKEFFHRRKAAIGSVVVRHPVVVIVPVGVVRRRLH